MYNTPFAHMRQRAGWPLKYNTLFVINVFIHAQVSYL